jgi:hypothetical protein
MNTKLHAVTDTSGRPIRFFISADPTLIETLFRMPCNGSAITPVQPLCSAVCQMRIGCSPPLIETTFRLLGSGPRL